MATTHYLKDTKAFWRSREKARKILDKKRANASYSEKIAISSKLRADTEYLKSGRVVSSKSSQTKASRPCGD